MNRAISARLRRQERISNRRGPGSRLRVEELEDRAVPASIVAENQLAGTPQSTWGVPGSGDSTIQGFATDISVDQGQTVSFKINDSANKPYHIDIYRMGYYQGNGARLVATIPNASVLKQVQPAPLTNTTTGLVDAGNWAVSASWAVPTTATSGLYFARVARDDTGGASLIWFVVRDDDGNSDLLFQTSDTTWQAYNAWGGYSLYQYQNTPASATANSVSDAGRAVKVSYNRPLVLDGISGGYGDYNSPLHAEYPMIRWLEANGYNVSYSTDVDSDRRGAEIREHKVFLSVGHDEYWSGGQRANVEAARDAGVNLAFFSGNESFWKVRWENSVDSSGTPYRTLVCYKESKDGARTDPLDQSQNVWTGTWRDTRFSPPADGGRPENGMSGVMYMADRTSTDLGIPMTVSEADGKLRFWRNTSVATLGTGQSATIGQFVVGYETDEDQDNGFRPAGLMTMSSTTFNTSSRVNVPWGTEVGSGTSTHKITLYRAPSGALVFGAGTVQWSWGLDGTHNNQSTTPSAQMRQATVNLFADMGVQPGSLQSGLTPAAISTDATRPTTAITAPAAGSTFQVGNVVTISGTATDAGGGRVAGVEVSTDGGATWHPAVGRASWTYSWTPASSGATTIKSRGVDDSGNVETAAAGVNVTVSTTNTYVAGYGFDEASGSTVTDSSGKGNAGTITSATRVAGKYGNGLSFNGSNAWVTIADANSLDLTGAMTLEAWVKPAVLNNWHSVILKEGAGSLSYALYANESLPRPGAFLRVGGADKEAFGNAQLPLNTWSHLAATYDGANVRLYLNAVQVGVLPLTGNIATTSNPLRIGGNSIWGEYFNGVIDEVRIYSRALLPSEIQNDMNTSVSTPDTTAPSVSLTAPVNNATVTGSISVSANASDNVGVAGVQFKLDGVNLGAEDTTSPYSITWGTGTSLNGTHQLTAVARDAAGNQTTSSVVNVTVSNADTTPPTVSLTAPADNATVGATVSVTATASDNVGVVGVQFLLDGNVLGAEDTTSPYSVNWDTLTATNSTHTLTARARDAAGNVTTSVARTVTVYNATSDPAVVGQWSSVMDNWPLVAMNAVLLNTGKVLMWDGGPDCIGAVSATLWDPATNTFTPAPSELQQHYRDIFCSGQTVLADGRVLVVGGHECDDPNFVGAAISNIFDPATGQWTDGPNMAFRRWYPTATTLPDGRVLVTAGSVHNTLDYVPIPEVYNPVSNSWTQLSSASQTIPNYPFMFVLPDGRVLAAGSDEAKMATYALNVATQTWSVIDPTVLDAGSAVMYAPGKIMKAGSSYLSAPTDNGGSTPSAATTYVLDMTQSTPAWQPTASMANPRTHLNLTVLPDGSVLATGGSRDIGGINSSTGVLAAELWNPTTKTWTTMSSMQRAREYHSTALLLPDGRIVVAGSGHNFANSYAEFSGEVYSPAYLFKGARPTVTSAPATLAYGNEFFVATPDATAITSVAVIRDGSVTHSFNMDQRYVPLSFRVVSGGLMVTAPADANLAPPGTYMLFLVNGNGVPAVAPLVRLPAAYEDTQAPSAPSGLTATASSISSIGLSWSAATDNVGVHHYNVYRSTTSGFTPSAANKIGQASGTSYSDAGLAAGTYYYRVTAQDAAGNIGAPSNESGASVTGDVTAPSVSITAPASGTTVSAAVNVTANASDDVGVAGVQFLLDGNPLGGEDTTAPYSVSWATTSTSNGSHNLSARARDTAGNTTTSSVISVTVNNSTGLVGAWGFEEGTGTTTSDVSGNLLTGTLSNATWTASGKYGKALSFNGTNAWVTVADNALLRLTNGVTVEAWVKPTAASTDWSAAVIKERTNGLAYALYATDGAAQPPAGYINRSGTDVKAAGSSALALNVWSHLAATYDAAAIRLYVNGTQVATRAQTGSITSSTNPLRIGGDAVWGEWFTGLIDEVRVYNRALTATEVTQDMNTPVGGGGGGLQLDGPPAAAGHPTPLTDEALAPVVAAAIDRWAIAGADPAGVAALRAVPVRIADLPGSELGFTSREAVWIDRDAAAYGWFVDPTPHHDEEFPATATSPAFGRPDLLTVVAHEFGHALGLEHESGERLMDSLLPLGTRRIPGTAEVDGEGPLRVLTRTPDAGQPAIATDISPDSSWLASQWGGVTFNSDQPEFASSGVDLRCTEFNCDPISNPEFTLTEACDNWNPAILMKMPTKPVARFLLTLPPADLGFDGTDVSVHSG